MANAEHVAMFIRGDEVWRKWRRENPEIRPDLSYLSFSQRQRLTLDLTGMALENADLRYSDFSGLVLTGWECCDADATGAKFDGAKLDFAWFMGAKLIRASFVHADLYAADFRNADVREADLTDQTLEGTVLFSADFREAILRGVDFTKAALGWSVFTGAVMDGVKGLEAAYYFHSSRDFPHTPDEYWPIAVLPYHLLEDPIREYEEHHGPIHIWRRSE